jgi:hypothetical protein
MSGYGSPDVGNYAIGKGFVLFQPEDAATFYHVGNVPSLTITPKITTLEHQSSMSGTRTKDQTIVLEKSADIKMQMEEITAQNIALLMLGDVDITDPTAPLVNIFSKSSIAGALRFYATNDVGPRWFADLKRVVFNPSGAFDPIGDKYMTMEVTGTLESVDGAFGTLQMLPAINTIAPSNLLVPYIAGQRSPASSPLAAYVGETLTAVVGAWLGVVGTGANISYQWKKGGTPLSGKTSKTYVPVSGDTGGILTVDVTATNSIGSTTLTTAATAAVSA